MTIANERVAMANEREAIAVKRAELAERWASMCETRARTMLLAHEAELRRRERSVWCQVACQEAAHRVARETERRCAAEEYAADAYQRALDIVVSTKAALHRAALCAEANRRTMERMLSRIS